MLTDHQNRAQEHENTRTRETSDTKALRRVERATKDSSLGVTAAWKPSRKELKGSDRRLEALAECTSGTKADDEDDEATTKSASRREVVESARRVCQERHDGCHNNAVSRRVETDAYPLCGQKPWSAMVGGSWSAMRTADEEIEQEDG